RKAPSFSSTVAISRCRAMRTAFIWAAVCLTKSDPTCASIGKKFLDRCCRLCGPRPMPRVWHSPTTMNLAMVLRFSPEMADWNRDWDVDSDHAHLNLRGEIARGIDAHGR